MPYKLNKLGRAALETLKQGSSSISPTSILTYRQIVALNYLADHEDEGRYIGAAEIADYLGDPNGQYFRGVLASLYHKGLIDKFEVSTATDQEEHARSSKEM